MYLPDNPPAAPDRPSYRSKPMLRRMFLLLGAVVVRERYFAGSSSYAHFHNGRVGLVDGFACQGGVHVNPFGACKSLLIHSFPPPIQRSTGVHVHEVAYREQDSSQ